MSNLPNAWRRSSFCEASSCVEVRTDGGTVRMRDGKLGEDSPVLTFTADEWRAFEAGVGAGEFSASGES